MAGIPEIPTFRFVFNRKGLVVAYCQGCVLTGRRVDEVQFDEGALSRSLISCSPDEKAAMQRALSRARQLMSFGGVVPSLGFQTFVKPSPR